MACSCCDPSPSVTNGTAMSAQSNVRLISRRTSMADCIEHNQKQQRYGVTSYRVGGKLRSIGMHRMAYCKAAMVSPESIEGLVVRHTCDNPRCINPDHLELGTHSDNMEDMKSRGRQAVGESQGRSTVSDADAQTIYNTYKSGAVSMHTLAGMYGVSKFAVYYIIHKRKSVCR